MSKFWPVVLWCREANASRNLYVYCPSHAHNVPSKYSGLGYATWQEALWEAVDLVHQEHTADTMKMPVWLPSVIESRRKPAYHKIVDTIEVVVRRIPLWEDTPCPEKVVEVTQRGNTQEK